MLLTSIYDTQIMPCHIRGNNFNLVMGVLGFVFAVVGAATDAWLKGSDLSRGPFECNDGPCVNWLSSMTVHHRCV